MLVCVNRSAAFHRALNRASDFAINVLCRAHIDISRLCSGGASPESRFNVGDWDTRAAAPVLIDAQAAIVCRKDKALDYGTHTVFMGRIVSVSMNGDVDPAHLPGRAIYRPRGLMIRESGGRSRLEPQVDLYGKC